MKLVDSAAMRELDRVTIEEIGIPGIVLMENAASGVFEVIRRTAGGIAGKSCLAVCGKGNNGGDGFAVARHLRNAGANVAVLLAARKKDIRGDAATNLRIALNMKIPVTEAPDTKALKAFFRKGGKWDIVIDALLGTGVRGAVRGHFADAIEAINGIGGMTFAVDLPSGVDADEGLVDGPAVRANHTVTFGLPKTGLFCYPGAGYCGRVYVVDIGIPTEMSNATPAAATLTSAPFVHALVRERAKDAHKGSCGKLLIVGGSRGMAGAPVLAALAALNTGAGLVYLAVPKGIVDVVQKRLTEGVVIPLPETPEGSLPASAADEILDRAKTVDAVVIGPGFTVTKDTRALARLLVEKLKGPVLVDADGLNCLANQTDVLTKSKAKIVLTPHPGEMAKLRNITTAEANARRIATARGAAKDFRAVAVLKGAGTVIAAPDGTIFINPTGNPGMATAGSGDVLSGVTGSLLAEGLSPVDAAACGAFIHGMAGDIAAARKGERSVMASDIARYIPAALATIEGKKLTSASTMKKEKK